MCVCNMKAIRLMVSDISSGSETRTHRRTDARRTTRYDDDNIPAPTSWAGDKKEHIRGILQFQAQALSTPCNIYY